MSAALDLRPGESFCPNSEAQAAVYWSDAPIVAYSGRLGSAKSRTLLEAADRDCRLWPGNKVAMCRKKAVDLFGSILDIYLGEVVHPIQRDDWRPGQIGGATMHYPNGSRMVWFGLDDPGKALGAQYGSIYIDQAEQLDMPEVETIEKRARLRLPPAKLDDGRLLPLRRRIVYAFNPSGDYHWANIRFGFKAMQPHRDPTTWTYRKVVRTEEPRLLLSGHTVPAGRVIYDVVIARPTDNVSNLPEDYQLVLTEQTGPYYDRMVGGLWGSFKGQAFPNFRGPGEEHPHVLEDPPVEWGWHEWGGYPPPNWKRYRSIDFGYENPFVMSWITRVPEDNPKFPGAWVHYQEIYRTKRIVSEHKKQAHQWDAEEVAALNRGIERWNANLPSGLDPFGRPTHRPMKLLERLSFSMQIADHDAEDRATLETNDSYGKGIVTDASVKERSSAIQLFHAALDRHQILFMKRARREVDPELDSKRRRMERPKPTCTWEEITGLSWPDDPTGDDKAAKEDIVKVDDHGFDSIKDHLRTFRDRGDIWSLRLTRSTLRDEDD